MEDLVKLLLLSLDCFSFSPNCSKNLTVFFQNEDTDVYNINISIISKT